MTETKLFLLALGVFYTAAGAITVRAILRDAWFNAALDALGGGPQDAATVERTWWLVIGGLLISAGGVMLLALSHWAVVPFVVSCIAQAVYLLVLAPRRFDPVDPPTPEGRQQTTNAFWIYLAMTVVIVRAAWIGALRPLTFSTLPSFVGALLLWSVGVVYSVSQLRRMSRLERPVTSDDVPSELPQPAELDDE